MSSATSGRSRLRLSDVELSAILSEAETGNLDWNWAAQCPGSVVATVGHRQRVTAGRHDGTVTCYESERGRQVSMATDPVSSVNITGLCNDASGALSWMRMAGLVR